MKAAAVLVGVLALTVAGVVYLIRPTAQPAPRLGDEYWGPGEQPRATDESVRPFKISFSDAMIKDLKQRLSNTRQVQPSLENVNWTYGVNSEFVPGLVDYWLRKYDFKKREAHLNRYPQFITNVQGLDIFFMRIKPQIPKGRNLKVLPLLILHGWPGSVVEFQTLIPLLTTPQPDRDFVFEVIAPSLPGFGFSDAASKPGMGPVEIAHLMKNLMLRLGFDRFYTQGGDWGAVVTSYLAAMYPQHVLGMHSNLCAVLNPWAYLKMAAYSSLPWLFPANKDQAKYPLSRLVHFVVQEGGYFHLQATKPDTLGVAMSDSPVGLATYILEKFLHNTDINIKNLKGASLLPWKKYTMDDLIDNIMLYWVPNKTASSFRIYAEYSSVRSFNHKMHSVPIPVPSACAQFPNEIIYQTPDILSGNFVNLVRVTQFPEGGHFAAMEQPEALADDIWRSIETMLKLEAEKNQKS